MLYLIRTEQEGVSSIEYAIIASLVAVTIILAVVFVGQETSSNFDCYNSSLQHQTDSC